jgi:CheY-like chemotaxis protein
MSEPLSILIVDDIPTMARSLADVLELKGYIVHVAYSGEGALAILQEHRVDILLTDVLMPEMNGVELYRATRKIYPKMTTWFMSAYAADDLITEGMKAGIRTVFNKPLDMELLFLFFRAASNLKY